MKKSLVYLFLLYILSINTYGEGIPLDSLGVYIKISIDKLNTHQDNFESITKITKGDLEADIANSIYSDLIDCQEIFKNLQAFISLYHSCSNLYSVQYGLACNLLALRRRIEQIQVSLNFTEKQIIAIQGNEAKKLLEEVDKNVINSFPNDTKNFIVDFLK